MLVWLSFKDVHGSILLVWLSIKDFMAVFCWFGCQSSPERKQLVWLSFKDVHGSILLVWLLFKDVHGSILLVWLSIKDFMAVFCWFGCQLKISWQYSVGLVVN